MADKGESLWSKLSERGYRGEFSGAILKRLVSLQIRAIRKSLGMTQEELALKAEITQGVVSRAEDPNYGNLTLNNIGRIAAGLDRAVICKFVPFSELVSFLDNLSEEQFEKLPDFENENRERSRSVTSNHEANPERRLNG